MRRTVLLLAAAVSAACGGDDDGGAGDGGQTGGDGAAVADASPIDAAGPRRIADSVIFIMRGQQAQIRFSDDPDGPASCMSEPVAGCEIQTCSAEVVVPPRPDAGLVSVTPAGGVGQSYLPDDSGTYPATPVSWEDGEAVTVEAAGAEVPAFTVEVTGPGDVESVVSPVYPGPIIARDQALLVEWTGTESFVGIAIRCPELEPIQMRCPFPDGTTGEVPVAALQRLPACTGATLSIFTEDRHVIEPGPEWPIRVGLRGAILMTTATVQ